MKRLALSRGVLAELSRRVRVPSYDPAAITAGIVHLGVGAFHRAHMARYTHNLMETRADALQWGIAGAGLLPTDQRVHDALRPQDLLYTLIERSDSDESVTVIGSLCDYLSAADDSAPLLDVIDARPVRIVSLTVTEHGYCLNPANKRLDLAHPMIAADLVNPERPHSAIGIVVEALRRRMVSARSPFTALCCDNIQHNGNVLRAAVLDFAERLDPTLASWIDRQGRFPSTMVDRITPVTRPDDVADLAERHGVVDNWPVFSETFTQWVIEDDFAQGRPDWDAVGAQFAADVAPYELMKLRLLNGSHLAIAGLGRLVGYRLIDQTMRDDGIRRYMTALMNRETGPTLLPVPGVDLEAYKAGLVDRFANPRIKDTVERVNADAPLNVLLDPIRARLNEGASIDLLSLGLAAWMRRVRGIDEEERAIEVRHPLADTLRARAIEGGADPRPLLAIDRIFGDLAHDERLVVPVGKWLRSLYEAGAAATLRHAAVVLRF